MWILIFFTVDLKNIRLKFFDKQRREAENLD